MALPRPLHGLRNEGAPLPRRGKDELASSARNLIPQFCLIRSRSRALASGDRRSPTVILTCLLFRDPCLRSAWGKITFLVSAVVAAGGRRHLLHYSFLLPQSSVTIIRNCDSGLGLASPRGSVPPSTLFLQNYSTGISPACASLRGTVVEKRLPRLLPHHRGCATVW